MSKYLDLGECTTSGDNFFPHPGYTANRDPKLSSRINDVAIIKFECTLPEDISFVEVYYQGKEIPTSTVVRAAGYGSAGFFSKLLPKAELSYVYSEYVGVLEERGVIMLHALNGRIVPGDSGGPAYIHKNGTTYIIGVGSSGIRDTSAAYYNHLFDYQEWIESYLNK